MALTPARVKAPPFGKVRRPLGHVSELEVAPLVSETQSTRELEEHLDLHAAPRAISRGQLHEERAPVELHDVAGPEGSREPHRADLAKAARLLDREPAM